MAAVPVEKIQAAAAEITPGRTVLAALAWAFYFAGWAAAMLMSRVVWGSARFVVASMRVGWADAVGPSKRSVIEAQRAQIAEYKMRLSRFEG